MDIFVIKVAESKNISTETLKQFQKKEISNQKAWNCHCLSYLMLDRILKEYYKIENREIVFENKKPFLKNRQKYFSISHSKDYISLAFSDTNCGIDIEKIKQKDYKKIALRMNFNSQSLVEFYLDWTNYEACYKLNSKAKSKQSFQIEDYIITAVSENLNEKFELFNSAN